MRPETLNHLEPAGSRGTGRRRSFSSAFTCPQSRRRSSTTTLPELPGGRKQYAKRENKITTKSFSSYQVWMQLCTYTNSRYCVKIDHLPDARRLLEEMDIRDGPAQMYTTCVVQHVIVLGEDPRAAVSMRARYHAAPISYHARA